MKTKHILFAAVFAIALSGCSVMNQIKTHCNVNSVHGNLLTGTFNVCETCDSLYTLKLQQTINASAKMGKKKIGKK